MPSKSRKKMKGQARKAKAKAAAANNEANNSCQQLRRRHVMDSIGRDGTMQTQPSTCICNHGLIQTTNESIVNFIVNFFNLFIKNILRLTTPGSTAKLTADALSEAYNKFPEAVNNESNRDIIKNNMISTGVSYLLGELGSNEPSTSAVMARSCAAVLMFIDSYVPSTPVRAGNLDDRDAKVWLRNLDILGGCQRSLVKYFVKQMPCNCLDDIYSQLRSTTPKMANCQNCRLFKEKTNMFICTGCERYTYCSKACQIAHVPKHKEYCKRMQSYDRAHDLR